MKSARRVDQSFLEAKFPLPSCTSKAPIRKKACAPWKRIKPWILGSDRDSERQDRVNDPSKSSLNDNKNRVLSKDITMVETRSRRRISPASNGVSETLTRPKPKKSSQAKDQGSANVVRVDDPEILKSITLQPGASLDGILTTQPKQLDPGSAQSLPHRSRGSKQLVDEAQPTGETPPGSMDTDKAADSYEEMEQSHSDVTVEVTEDATMIKQTSQVTIKEMESGTGSEDHVISVSTQEKNAKRKRSSKSEPSSKKIHSASISNHKRFGSEDPVPELKVPQAHVEDLRMSNQSEIVDDESEDDIPEEVTAVTAAQEAKASATKTAQSIKMYVSIAKMIDLY